MVTDRPGERRSKAPPRTTPSRQVSQAERQAAFSRNKAEYRRRMLRDGPAAANRWLDEQAGAAPADARPRATTRTGQTSCKKVRWVNRAPPGFGGGPMTRSRGAVCADEVARDALPPDPARIKPLSETAPPE